MASFKWIHLSDLHIQENDSFDRSRVLRALFDDLANRDKRDEKLHDIDAVFFTGDMAFHGYAQEYKLAEVEFVNPLIDTLGITKDKFFMVPGNHDVNCEVHQRFVVQLHDELKSSNDITGFLKNENDRDICTRRLKSYLTSFKEFSQNKEIKMPGWFFTEQVSIGGKNIAIIGLNTAWICTGKEMDKPCLGDIQVEEAIKANQNAHITFVLFHHPIGKWPDNDDTRQCENVLQNKCALWLHGHTHRESVRTVMAPKGRWIELCSGAIFDDRKSPLTYNLGFVDLDKGTGTIFLRKYDKENNKWIADLGATDEEAGGSVSIEIESIRSHVRDAKESDSGSYCTSTMASGQQMYSHPFSTVAAESMNTEDITRLFVGTHTKLNIVTKRFGTILEGQRGTGKSMILKYLSFAVQLKAWQNEGRTAKDYINQKNIIGVYSKLPQGVFDKQDLSDITHKTTRNQVFEHRLTALLCVDIIETMKEVMDHLQFSEGTQNRLKSRISRILDAPKEWLNAASSLKDIFDAYRDALRKEATRVDEFLRDTSSSDFRPHLFLRTSMYGLLELFHECPGISNCCFFLLIDDFDVLHDWQQEILFALAAERKFNLVCFKFGTMSEGKKTSFSGLGRTFRPGDDYDPVTLDMTERGKLRHDYHDAINLIVAKRLKESGWDDLLGQPLPQMDDKIDDIDTQREVIMVVKALMSNIFPAWSHGQELREDLRQKMNHEWDIASKKPTKKKGDYFSKYGNARYFQELSSRKTGERYAGYDYITAVSSGIVRQFLEICSEIIGEAYDNRWHPKSGQGISSDIQDRAIRNYSESFFQNLNKGAGAHGKEEVGRPVSSRDVSALIEALSTLFYERLHYKGHGEPEILAFALKDSDPYVEALLKVCVRESVLHKFYYPSKTAGESPLPTYILNRRLVPRRSLSALRMQGRIEMNSPYIRLAINNSNKFLKRFMPKGYTAPDDLTLF